MINWRKSSYSGGGDDRDCVELAELGDAVGVRDSKNPNGGNLALASAVFGALARQIKSGRYDR